MSILLEDFVLRAMLAGLALSALTGPLGCFVVWRRMAYFGDCMAHGALLGVAFSLMTTLPMLPAVLGVGVLLALFLGSFADRGPYAADTLLGIFSHGALALGLVLVGLSGARVDLMAFLFGDILLVDGQDLAVIAIGGGFILALLLWFWRPLLSASLDAELAAAEGVRVGRMNLMLSLLVAVTVALAMKIVGILLITALLIIPAAAARGLARTPEAMAVIAVGAGALSTLGGVSLSALADTPAGPSIVLVAFALFGLAISLNRLVAHPGS